MDANTIVLDEREMEIISILSGAMEIGPTKTVKDSISAILSGVRKKHWTKYEFHDYNVPARSFIKICRKLNLYGRVPLELKAMFPEHEILVFDE